MTTRTLYHGTFNDFETFDPAYGEGIGIHFADDPGPCRKLLYTKRRSDQPAGRILECRVQIEHPLDVADQKNWSPVLLGRDALDHGVLSEEQQQAFEKRVTDHLMAFYTGEDLADGLSGDGPALPEDELNEQDEMWQEWCDEGKAEDLEGGDLSVLPEMMREARERVPKFAANFEYRAASRELLKSIRHDVVSAIKAAGYDGLRYRNTYEGGTGYVVFDAGQVIEVQTANDPQPAMTF